MPRVSPEISAASRRRVRVSSSLRWVTPETLSNRAFALRKLVTDETPSRRVASARAPTPANSFFEIEREDTAILLICLAAV
jgi:hypothetical protein